MDLTKIVREIKAGKATFLRRENSRITVWHVEHEGQAMEVLYDKYRHSMVTVLKPGDSIWQNANESEGQADEEN
jgi:hypothetical protein